MRIAVTGASGSLGSQVIRLLSGEHDVVAVGRHTTDFQRQVYADYADLGALRSALRGIDTLVFISSDGDAAKVMLHHHNVISAAIDNDIAHVVALSGVDADLDSPFCYAVTNGYTEWLLRDHRYSIVRASIYTEFFLRWLITARGSSEMRLPAGDGRISLVSRSDVGRCLAALAAGAPTGRLHEITGPASLDLSAIAAIAAESWRTPIRYVDCTPADFSTAMATADEDPWWAYAFSSMFASIRQQRWDVVSDEVSRLTGQSPRTLSQLLREKGSSG